MAMPSSSRWGSFLSNAVAGVEARLDNILADEEASQQDKTPSSASDKDKVKDGEREKPVKPSPAIPRSSSARGNDRLQERLARAVAAKNAAAGRRPDASPVNTTAGASPRQSIDAPARLSTESASPNLDNDIALTPSSPRTSQDVGSRPSLETKAPDAQASAQAVEEPTDTTPSDSQVNGKGPRPGVSSPPPQLHITPPQPILPPGVGSEPIDAIENADIKRLQQELEETKRQHQEEIHDYVEKLDALQSKLQYLSRGATDAAKKAAQEAPSGSMEKKLAEKDQQIAQLMEEGKSLGVTEQKHRTILKKLRAKIADDEKEIAEARAAKDKIQAEAETFKTQATRTTELERAVEDSKKRVRQSQRDVDTLKTDMRSKDRMISELTSQLRRTKEEGEAAKAKINDEALETARKRVRDLEDQVAELQVEKNLTAERGKAQANEQREKAERAAERAKALEIEMKAEVQIMESKLEAMRIRAEEASSGATGDTHSKLLRQVETLQSQYSIASENWQGIEATLLVRITNLERERDEALQRESDMRKKARETSLRAKRQEDELEEARSKLPAAQQDVDALKKQMESWKKRADEADANLREVRTEFEKQKSLWRSEKQDRDRSNSNGRGEWLDDLPSHSLKTNSRPESPLLSPPSRTWSSDFLGISSLSSKLRKPSAPSSVEDSVERFSGRRLSAQPAASRASGQPSSPLPLFSPSVDSLQPPSTHPLDQEENIDPVELPASPRNVLQDMVSVSTVAAGPSVQLVERMSAAIRRLESEKVAAREELARISNQRDEARAEIVSLMRNVEEGKSALDRVTNLEAEVADVNARYETTLELLGEKSELVEELKADVQDVKAMYRDLVERTIK